MLFCFWDNRINMKLRKETGRNKEVPLKFDKETFFISTGVGIVTMGIGVLIIWATYTAPEGPTQSTPFTLYQRISHLLPRSIQEKIAFMLALLFILYGFVCLLLGIKTAIQFWWAKLNKKSL
jgi:hypothetical protein